MLTLTRKKGEEIVIGDNIVITVKEISSDSVRISVTAPRDVPVFRRELKMAMQENREAAAAGADAAQIAALLSQGGMPSKEGRERKNAIRSNTRPDHRESPDRQ